MSTADFEPQPDWQLLSQGAEARVWKMQLDGRPAVAKERFHKRYRHPVLDARLTKSRTKAEAKILTKCRKNGLNVPEVLRSSPPVLYLEYLDGALTLREHLEEMLNDSSGRLKPIIGSLGAVLARLHGLGIVHGDLTTSNIMIRQHNLYLIDFGLAKNTESAEERAVDLYVLERALTSTHPRLPEDFLDQVLAVYRQQGTDAKKTSSTLARLDQVRLRGRKRECFG